MASGTSATDRDMLSDLVICKEASYISIYRFREHMSYSSYGESRFLHDVAEGALFSDI